VIQTARSAVEKYRLSCIAAAVEGDVSFEEQTTSYRLSLPQQSRVTPSWRPPLTCLAGLNFVHDKVANEDRASESFGVQPLRCEERFLMTSQHPSFSRPAHLCMAGERAAHRGAREVTASVGVRNTGARAGEEIVAMRGPGSAGRADSRYEPR
jgi:hypothetical protein